ncbi:MAG: hypothetical protein ABSA05_06765 [Opitutaceae bacterium]
MKSFRRILKPAGYAIALAAVLGALAFAPFVQTLIAQAYLDSHPALRCTVGSVSAGFGKVEFEDLRFEFDGATLTVPSLEARLPLVAAVRDRKVLVRGLVARGWTLDLRRLRQSETARVESAAAPGAAGKAQGDIPPAQKAARAMHQILGAWALPCDLSLDGVELEGDLVIPGALEKSSTRLHVAIRGGGLAAGHDGSFAFDASDAVVNPDLSVSAYAAHGRLVVSPASPRTLDRIELKADLSAKGGSLPAEVTFSAGLTAAGAPGGEDYALDLARGGRHVATVNGRFPSAAGGFAGTWKIDLRDSDLTPFFPDNPLPAVAAAGDGQFDTDAAFARAHALGRINATAGRLGVLAPSLDRIGPVALDARFDLAHSGQTLRVGQLSLALTATGPNALLKSLQPFDVDEATGRLKVANPQGDWMEGAIRGFPMAWLSGPNDVLAFAGGIANGEFAVRAANGELALRSKAPITAAGVSLLDSGRVVARDLDLSLSLLAGFSSNGWQAEGAPLTLGSAGRRLATLNAKAARPGGADQPIAITGTWDADLEALAALPAVPGARWITGRSASGDFSASVGGGTEVDAKLTALGHDPGKSIAGSIHADFNADGSIGFLAPFKVAFGSSASDLSAEGTWSRDQAGARIEAKLTGQSVALEHLRLLAAMAASAAGAPVSADLAPGPDRKPAEARDRIPFWGDWTGSLTVGFDRMRAGDRDYVDVGGTFVADPRSLRLQYGRGVIPRHSPANAEGSISFDAAARLPYSLNATASVKEVEAAPFFGTPQHGEDPVLEGRFSVSSSLTGDGATLEGLVSRTREEFHLTSTAGIVRLLKTNVAESLPEASTPVSDTLGSVGSLMGSLIGVRRDTSKVGEIRLNKTTEAVLDFTNQVSEIGYDQFTLSGTREADGSIQIAELAMTAPSERLTGSGRIAGAKGLSASARPLSLDLQFSARGKVAELLSTAGLLSAQKDKLGYAPLSQPVHFGGTLEHIDDAAWHDLLVKAATPKPGGSDKSGPKGGP